MNRPQRLARAGIVAILVLLGPAPRRGRAAGADDLRPQLVAQVGHSGAVDRIAFSPDGRTVLTAAGIGDPTPRLWEVATGRLIRPFVGHDGAIMDIDYSPDGRHVLSGGWDKTARLWEAATGREIHRFVGHTYHVSSVAFSPDGRTAATGSLDRTVRLWDVESGRERPRRFEGKFQVNTAKFAPDGKMVLIGHINGGGLLWDPSEGRTIRRIGPGNGSNFEGATFAPDGRSILSWGRVQDTNLWDVATGRLLRTFPASTAQSADSAAFAPDGKTILTASDGVLRDAASGASVRKYDLGEHRAGSVAFAPDGRLFLTGGDGQAWLRDTATGKELARFAGRVAPLDAVAPGAEPSTIRVQARVQYRADPRPPGAIGFPTGKTTQDAMTWDLVKGREARRVSAEPSKPRILGMTIWPDRTRYLIRQGDSSAIPKDPKTGRPIPVVRFAFIPTLVVVSPDGSRVMTNGGGSGILWDLKTGRMVREFKADTRGVMAYAFSPDGRWILAGDTDTTARVWDIESGRELGRFSGHTDRVTAVAGSADSRQVLTGSRDKTARLWDVATGRELWRADGHQDAVKSVAFAADGQTVLTASDDGMTGLWDRGTGRDLGRLVSFPDDSWAVLAPDGRFDTNRPGDLPDLHWVFPDDPFRPLAAEIFLRDNFEPRLLPQVLARKPARRMRPLSDVNRVQPGIAVLGIDPAGRPDEVAVTVELAAAEGTFARGGRETVMKTGAYDLRLFRDGRLVARRPETADDGAPEPDPTSRDQMDAWRIAGRIPLDPTTHTARFTISVRLPHRDSAAPVAFTAYAFNEDRVKSATAMAAYQAPANPIRGKARAYLIAMGVGACQTRAWDLRFAAADARLMLAALGGAVERAGRYDVVHVPLISERTPDGGSVTATKANLRAALDLLAGRPVTADARAALPAADSLRPVTPDDLVIVTFSGHGYTDPRGTFFLIPHDVGGDHATVISALPHCISSAELSAWLRPVDAGSLALIVDACHSAAAIQQAGFKPGPLGGRGLGQLAYDKGMRVLAASQAEAVALESRAIRQGLLTYALAKEGLGDRRAAGKGGLITLGAVLAYAAERVPSLYGEVRSGRVHDADGRAVHDVVVVRELETAGRGMADGKADERQLVPAGGGAGAVQRPELFDYHGSQSDVVLSNPRTQD